MHSRSDSPEITMRWIDGTLRLKLGEDLRTELGLNRFFVVVNRSNLLF